VWQSTGDLSALTSRANRGIRKARGVCDAEKGSLLSSVDGLHVLSTRSLGRQPDGMTTAVASAHPVNRESSDAAQDTIAMSLDRRVPLVLPDLTEQPNVVDSSAVLAGSKPCRASGQQRLHSEQATAGVRFQAAAVSRSGCADNLVRAVAAEDMPLNAPAAYKESHTPIDDEGLRSSSSLACPSAMMPQVIFALLKSFTPWSRGGSSLGELRLDAIYLSTYFNLLPSGYLVVLFQFHQNVASMIWACNSDVVHPRMLLDIELHLL
jgi:hypothetical protein